MLKLIVIIATIGSIIIVSESKTCYGPHEYYEDCVRTCDPQTCESIGKVYHCLNKNKKCEEQCRCKPGYYRNKSGECITEDQCDYEKYDKVSVTLNQTTKSKNSYKAILKQSTDSSRSEDYSSYSSDSSLSSSSTIEDSSSSSSDSSLSSLSTDGENTIIIIDYSTSIFGPNEIWTNYVNAECGNQNFFHFGSPDICFNIREYYCISSCRCKRNYLRNELGMCIAVCGINEVFDLCPASCPPKRCDVDERLVKCKKPPQFGNKECNPDCRCADGFYRNNEGACVTKDQCLQEPLMVGDIATSPMMSRMSVDRSFDPSAKCHGKNEVYEECPRTCPPQTCQSIWTKYKCLVQPAVCKPACRCKPNMYRNQIGECISRDECLKCPGPHEYYSCGGACDNECDKLSKQNQTSCPIINITCNKKCYCAAGYARNQQNQCVPFAECPHLNGKDRPQFCWQYLLGFKEQGASKPRIPGCSCVEGYARNNNGVCILISDCFENRIRNKRGSDRCNENEEYVTNVNAIDRPLDCFSYLLSSQKNKSSQTGKPGCICVKNYVKNNAGKCIPSEDCINIILRC